MTAPRVPGALAATWTMAVLTWRRLIRGRALWVSVLIAVIPVIYAGAVPSHARLSIQNQLFAFALLVMAVLAPMFVGASIGEDIEDRTATYLWSRPVPRWTVLAGKVVALAPLAAAIVVGSWGLSGWVAWSRVPPAESFAALALATLVVSLISMGIASLAPKHGMALTIIYMLFFDFPVGVLPATLREISVSYQARALLDPEVSTAHGLVAMGVIAGVWTLIATWRIRRLEV